ncbi:hypothetical protein KSX_89260 [Ktedonospora formicarum]|uniref:Uncharacterized protein n=1 Tax=Ktedonospora formicarum TaxID=2778364 RepID=A0A8J3IEA0_9CHLR|nr:hypothetical protein KSX_89260 [Ktedonospora formicarum]
MLSFPVEGQLLRELQQFARDNKGKSGHAIAIIKVESRSRQHPFETEKMSSPIRVDDFGDLAGPNVLRVLRQVGNDLAREAQTEFVSAYPGVKTSFLSSRQIFLSIDICCSCIRPSFLLEFLLVR